ncbi:hypothetical protein SAMN02746041_00037 [Desulfacinum hydrothermale DSM 13146]|uniref:Gluconate 2-dehydrogenase subunit 3 n=1 Tax=Desulfacinum hydrothermale DSM 13146 TaxID=1121390 RepID=A0A1W1WX02_9BACT|nr:hypothetical protein [Desulfacinum hydrothermale]SMC16252.1 hypothetical protein SAMN02746041_00037 [Desulfacinum hydrothermale DSM 13146]
MEPLGSQSWKRLAALAHTLVPETASLSAQQSDRFRHIIRQALMERPAAVALQLRLFLALVDLAAAWRYGTRFARLSDPKRQRLLAWFQDGPVPLFRKGFWGLKTLVFMGYYGQDELWPRFNYQPVMNGNDVLHERKGL